MKENTKLTVVPQTQCSLTLPPTPQKGLYSKDLQTSKFSYTESIKKESWPFSATNTYTP